MTHTSHAIDPLSAFAAAGVDAARGWAGAGVGAGAAAGCGVGEARGAGAAEADVRSATLLFADLPVVALAAGLAAELFATLAFFATGDFFAAGLATTLFFAAVAFFTAGLVAALVGEAAFLRVVFFAVLSCAIQRSSFAGRSVAAMFLLAVVDTRRGFTRQANPMPG